MNKIILWCYHHSLMVFCALTLISLLAIFQIPHLKIDVSSEKMMTQKGKDYQTYQKTIETFGSDNISLIIFKDINIFQKDKLLKIKNFISKLEDQKGVTKVDSLFNKKIMKWTDGSIDSNTFFTEQLSENQAQLNSLRSDALGDENISGHFIAKDGNALILKAVLLSEKGQLEKNLGLKLSLEIDKLLEEEKGHFQEVYQYGGPYLRSSIKTLLEKDQKFIIPLSFLLICIIFSFLLNSVHGFLLPICTGFISILWTLGFMAMIDIPMQILTMIIPCLIFVIGSSEDVHIISQYFQNIQSGKEKNLSFKDLSNKISLALLLTSITSFLGFYSISFHDVVMLKEFGIVGSFGLFANFLVTVSFAPMYLKLFGPTKIQNEKKRFDDSQLVERTSNFIIGLITQKGRTLPIIFTTIILILLAGTLKLRVENDPLSYFKQDSEIIIRNQKIKDMLTGTQFFYLILESSTPSAFKQKESLRYTGEIQSFIKNSTTLSSSHSLQDQISLINREMHSGDPQHFKIPEDNNLIAQYLLFLPYDQLKTLVTSNYQKISIAITHNLTSSYKLREQLNSLKDYLDKNSHQYGITYHITGESILIDRAVDSLAIDQVKSLGTLLLIIFIFMSVLFFNIKLGFLSILSNGVPIIFLFGIMGYLGIPINTGTALVAAITIGIAVDDTIHLLVHYNYQIKRNEFEFDALKQTIKDEIRPVFTTSISMAIGLFILGFSHFIPIIQFGLLSGTVMIVALLCDLFITTYLLRQIKVITILDVINLKLNPQVLYQSPLLATLSKWEVRKIVLLGKLRTYRQDELIVRQGDVAQKMYLLLSGEAVIEKIEEQDKVQFLGRLKSGDEFGENSLAESYQWVASVRSQTEETLTVEFKWSDLEKMLKTYPRTARKFFFNMSFLLIKRLNNLIVKGVLLSSRSTEVRMNEVAPVLIKNGSLQSTMVTENISSQGLLLKNDRLNNLQPFCCVGDNIEIVFGGGNRQGQKFAGKVVRVNQDESNHLYGVQLLGDRIYV